MATKLGEYSVRAGGAAVNLWPLNPGTTVAQATPPAPVAPVNPNPIVQPATFAIFDVVVRLTDEPVVQTTVSDPALLARVSGTASISSMPLIQQPDGTAHICFAVSPSSGNIFEGQLRFSASSGSPAKAFTCDLAIRAAVNSVTDNLVVLFVVSDPFPATYAWVKMRVRQRTANVPIHGASVDAKIVRDNNALKRPVQRALSLQTGGTGYVAQGNRDVIGLPIDWPIIFSASAAGYVSRGHMIRLKAGDIHHNMAAFEPATSVEMMRLADASLAGKKILLDPGHGVVYGNPTPAVPVARRSNEWYVASRIADEIENILTGDHHVAAANVLRTRTAGFGLIEPTQLGSGTAPEAGKDKFEYEMLTKRMRIRQAALGLKDLSDIVLTTHVDPGDAQQSVAPAARDRLLALNATTLVAISARLNVSHAPARRVRPGSIRWDAGRNDYVYTHDPVATPNSGGVDAHLPITTSDWFTIDDAMLRILIDRTARWSLAQEIGAGPLALGARPKFIEAARTAVQSAGGRNYMTQRIWNELDLKSPRDDSAYSTDPNGKVVHKYSYHVPHGWDVEDRIIFMNGQPCDLYVSLHENASGKANAATTAQLTSFGGGACIVSGRTGADEPPADQIRLSKVFAKYLDPFDQGLNEGGVTKEVPANPVGMLHSQNTVRDKHVYIEMEFMDAVDSANPNRYRYESMVDVAFVNRVAQQVVNAIVEALLAPQSDLDSVKLHSQLPNTVSPLW